MMRFTRGNLLDSGAEALVNTVNTVGVMGKGIALAFKEAFPDNFKSYAAACKVGQVEIGRMFVTTRQQLLGPRWIINFPTKEHWRNPSRMEWIDAGLIDLHRVIVESGVGSIAIPPLGSGNGGLDWSLVRPRIEAALADLKGIEIQIFEPDRNDHTVLKRAGKAGLTPSGALVAELVRRYSILGIECSLLEVQKLAYFLERNIKAMGSASSLDLRFEASRFGPYADRLRHLLEELDGTYLCCEKRIADAGAFDGIRFQDEAKERVAAYLSTPDMDQLRPALEATTDLIEGFQSPLGMELLATVDWILQHQDTAPSVSNVRAALREWPGGPKSAERKLALFDDRLIGVALRRLAPMP